MLQLSLHITLNHLVICLPTCKSPVKFEWLRGIKTMNTWHDPWGSNCPGVFATRGKCYWRLKDGKGWKVLTLLQENISKQYHNVSYMKGQWAELCRFIQCPDHLLIVIIICLVDSCVEWGWGGGGERKVFLLCVQKKSGSVTMSGNADMENWTEEGI